MENYSRHFDSYYYEHGCGRPYQRDEEWLGFFDTIAQQIAEKIQPKKVLDAGCALGFLVEKLREREIEAYGVDISEYAIANTHEAIKPYCWVGSVSESFPEQYDLIVSIEVLEHMPKTDAERAIKNFCNHADDILFSSTPMDYKEATHFNVQQPEYWVEQFALQGFYRDVDFDASFITPWAIRFRKRSEPIHAIIKDYERKFWPLWKESTDLRALVEEMRTRLARAESELEVLVNTKDTQITSLNAEVQSLTQQVNSLSEQINDWHNHWTSIQSGMSWRLVQALIRIQPRLAPSGSRRYQFLVWLFENARKLARRLRKDNPTDNLEGIQDSGADSDTLHNPSVTVLSNLEVAPLRVAVYTRDPWTAACSHLRIIGPTYHADSGVRALEGVRWEQPPTLFTPDEADVVLIQRDFPRHEDLYAEVIEWARSTGRPVLYELDDLLVELPEEHPERYYYDDSRAAMLTAMKDADGVIVSTQPLAEYARRYNQNVWVLPNYLDERIWSVKTHSPVKKTNTVVIGYMGGVTKTHIPDLELVLPVLVRLLKRYKGKLKLRFWGMIHPDLQNNPLVEYQSEKFPNYLEFARYFSSQYCDLFIAPLRNSLFNRSKSAIKYLEYSASGIPGVYSDITPYSSIIVNGINGYLAADEDDWEMYLCELIDDLSLRRSMGEAALQTVRENFLMSNHAHAWGTIYRAAIANQRTGMDPDTRVHSETQARSAL